MVDYQEFLSSKKRKNNSLTGATRNFLCSFLLPYFSSAKKIMDLGGGDGARITVFIEENDKKELFFIEPMQSELELAKKRFATYQTQVHYLSSLQEVTDNKFDVIYVGAVFELFEENVIADYLKKLNDLLADNGVLIIFNTHYSPFSFDSTRFRLLGLLKYKKMRYVFSPYQYHIEKKFYRNKLSHQEFLNLLNSCGFTVKNVFPFFYVRNYAWLRFMETIRFMELKLIHSIPWLSKLYSKVSCGNYIVCKKTAK